MPVNLAHCDACGQQIVLAAYVPLDVVPRERDDEYANYALSVGRTTCHRITEEWPLDPAETRHTIHFATCPAGGEAS